MKKLTDGWQVMAMPHMTLWVRWANKKRSKNNKSPKQLGRLKYQNQRTKIWWQLAHLKKKTIICYERFILSKMSFVYKSQEHTNKG